MLTTQYLTTTAALSFGAADTLHGSGFLAVYLTGLALALGAREFLIGIIAALPLASKLGQLYLSWRIERAGRWRRTALVSAVISRATQRSVSSVAGL